MKKDNSGPKDASGGRLGSILENLVHLATWTKGWLEGLTDRLERHFERFLRRFAGLLLLFILMSVGCIFFFTGLLLYIAEKTGASNGFIFGIGGAFLFLFCALALVLRSK